MGKVGRNDPCPCGSGKKYKTCCLSKDRKTRRELQNTHQDGETGDTPSSSQHVRKGNTNDDLSFESDFSPPESPYPQVDMSLPELPPEKEEIVDVWCDDFMSAMDSKNVDKMIELIEGIMRGYPDLFVHLGLDDMGLFELGDILSERGEQSRYAAILMRIRREHPEMYVRAFGPYDVQVFAEIILRGKQEKLTEYFNFFNEYPDSNPDELKYIVNMLAATNCQKQLFELVNSTAIPCVEPPKVMGGNFVFQWYVFREWLPFLEEGDTSEEAIEAQVRKLQDLDAPSGVEFGEESIRQYALSIFKNPTPERQLATTNPEDYKSFCSEVSNNFLLFLHEQRGVSWATARFFANRIKSHLCNQSTRFQPGQALNFHQDPLEEYISSLQAFLMLDGISAMATLQAVYEFISYMEENELQYTPNPADIRKIAHNLHEKCLDEMSGDDPAHRLFTSFPQYRWVD